MFKIVALSCLLLVQLAYGNVVQRVNADVDAPHIINDCLNPGKNPAFLYNQEISKAGAFLKTQEETRRFPESGFFPKPITCITVTNLDSDKDAGYPDIKTGGVGNTYVTINFESQFGEGYDFQVSIYYDNCTKKAI